MKINPKFIVTKYEVHFHPMHNSSSNTEATKLKCTVFLRVDNVQNNMCLERFTLIWLLVKIRYSTDIMINVTSSRARFSDTDFSRASR